LVEREKKTRTRVEKMLRRRIVRWVKVVVRAALNTGVSPLRPTAFGRDDEILRWFVNAGLSTAPSARFACSGSGRDEKVWRGSGRDDKFSRLDGRRRWRLRQAVAMAVGAKRLQGKSQTRWSDQ
jgi:hypothetical protein